MTTMSDGTGHTEECTVWNCNSIHHQRKPVVKRLGYASLAKETGL